MSNIVWEFTNQKKLNKSEFIDYFERKVFRTIRKYNMLPEDKIIKLKETDYLNYKVLKQIIDKKFETKNSNKPNILDDNLSEVAEKTFGNILNGNFSGPTPNKRPLYFLSDKEVELYAKLTNIDGKKRKQNKKIQNLFEKFLNKNQDLEINIIKALAQINKN